MMVDDGQPVLPYAGSSGWSGSDTSHERADRDDTTGVTGRRQRQTVALLHEVGETGLTWRELADILDVHHGAASGALSVLHKDGRIARLSHRRGGSKVYVLPEYVAGRVTERPGHNKRTVDNEEALAKVRDLVKPQWRIVPADLPDTTAEAFTAGRNWMIDRIREALSNEEDTNT
jgi:hypothetical protein